MDHNEILTKLNETFRNVFDRQDIELNDETTADDIEGWNSLTNVRLLVQIEMDFRINFNSTEIADIQNVGELVDLIINKQ